MSDMMQTVRERRSIRRFARTPVPRDALEQMAEAARLSPTGVNKQPLRFVVVSAPALCAQIFPSTYWARRIPDGSAGPTEATQPAAYILLLADTTINSGHVDMDAGAAAMSIQLAAQSEGIGSCWLASIDRPAILKLLGIDAERFKLHTLVALGYPAMRAKAVPMTGDDTDYYLLDPDTLAVPKRPAQDVICWMED
ncbi:MAG: nitroreductase family protein [Oscillospiraceae bacterium]|jgi:nitroreductase|nr:nitroreductase family protein [Oscillospiraceae bacterium]